MLNSSTITRIHAVVFFTRQCRAILAEWHLNQAFLKHQLVRRFLVSKTLHHEKARTGRPVVERIVLGQNRIPCAPAPPPVRVGAANLMTMVVKPRKETKCLNHRFIVDRTKEMYLSRGGIFHWHCLVFFF